MYTVFISHAFQDDRFVCRLANDLLRLGVRVWIAPQSIRPGEDWERAIERGLTDSSHIVIVLTPAALASEWMEKETNVAVALERRGRVKVIPLDVQPCKVPPPLSDHKMVSFRDDYDAGLSQLAEILGVRFRPPGSARLPRAASPYGPMPGVMRPAVIERFQPFEPEMVLIPAGEFLGVLGNRDDTVIDRVIDWVFEASAADEERRSLVALDILRRVDAGQLASRLVINMVERPLEHRAKIEEILWAAAGEATVEGLITLARDSSAEFAHRERAIELLGRIGGDKIMEPLVDLLKDDPSVLIRAAAARVLGEMAAREHKDALQALLDDALTDPDEIVRSQAAIALPRTPPSLRPLLMDVLRDKTRDSEVRHVLIDSLGALGDEEAVATLDRVAQDETEGEMIHLHARRTLESLRSSW